MNRPRKHCGQIPKPLGKRRDYFKIAEGDLLSKKGTSPPVETGVDSPEKKECLPEECDAKNTKLHERRTTPGSADKERERSRRERAGEG